MINFAIMLPIYHSSQIKAWDQFTIDTEPISSIDLMDRAAMVCVEWISRNISHEKQLYIFCGNGNNGGDGLAMARMLLHAKYEVITYTSPDTNRSANNQINLERLRSYAYANIVTIKEGEKIVIDSHSVIIDALFGTGLNKPIFGFWKEVIGSINQSNALKISIDIPSGLLADFDGEDISFNIPEADSVVYADHTLTFQAPKPSMMLAGWGNFCGNLRILDIGLSKSFLPSTPCKDFYITQTGVFELYKKRNSFSHKGTYGHALIIAGGTGKCGAAVLSASACIKSGAGLVSLLSDETCSHAVYSTTPEIMIENSEIKDLNFENYTSIGCGPGIGKDAKSYETVNDICNSKGIPLVLDADAINILSQLNESFELPALTIITPHPKEFDRLAGPSTNSFERLKKAKALAVNKNIFVLLKGTHTAVCCPSGDTFFNSTGNPGMATAGSGDVLTGIIASFLAQGYSPLNAAVISVYCHGMAGDLSADFYSQTGMTASNIIEFLNPVFKGFESKED